MNSNTYMHSENDVYSKRLYIDIDGTLARFHDVDKHFIEAMWQEGFYRDLKPFENILEAVAIFVQSHPEVEVYTLSAVLETDPPFAEKEKNEWLDKYLPEIDRDHRIFTQAGHDKSEYIPNLSKDDYLLDDYNRNLREFEAAGANSIKFKNDINHRGEGAYGGEKGALWSGRMVSYDSSPEELCSQLEEFLGVVPVRSADILRSCNDVPTNTCSEIAQRRTRKNVCSLDQKISDAQNKVIYKTDSMSPSHKITK